ncbi:PGF-CTERM-anchored ABC transporter substrate-binding protein [Halalkaliarchaeum sp. AArc-GB]|uniref:PGF-CTERM-anchored ABC transporter substrate-binding protein n=1 Tax=unclassified Halalkaliarchaeum TaxID=2678344 RepID=UPI00285F36A7|nr:MULTISPECIES: PGF-CTERM-anchored ABC transporter substrate-binding protein [unclassified Halalkaliarchaeum]MDR5673979.1 PGF-CTERM-anchored ABC transporter substrate-binding protein [Halalkaliarchaeum sp. AArc-GB]
MQRTAIVVSILVLLAGVGVAPAAGAASSSVADVDEPDATYEPCEFPVELTDATGETVTIEEKPERVTTIGPSAAQTMWEIGGEEQVVGVSQFAHYLDGAEEKANVSAEFGASVEQVVATDPDLVLAPNVSAQDVEPLREAGLTVYHFPEATDTDDVAEKTETIGKLTGNCEGAAEANAWMHANVDALNSVTAEADERPAALYPLGDGFVAGGNTFIDEIITVSGADNVAHEHEDFPQLNDEVLLEMDPEVLVVTMPGVFLEQEPYASTTAGETESEVVVDVQWLNQPAPRSMVEATHELAAQLHPELYDESVYVERSEITVESVDEAAEEESTEAQETEEEGADEQTPEETPDDAADVTTPGFGVVVALVGTLLAALLALRRVE